MPTDVGVGYSVTRDILAPREQVMLHVMKSDRVASYKRSPRFTHSTGSETDDIQLLRQCKQEIQKFRKVNSPITRSFLSQNLRSLEGMDKETTANHLAKNHVER